MKRALTIAGSDSGGGAGIQADLKTFTVFGVFGMSAITALTAQNTVGVQAVLELPAEFVRQQIDSVVTDIGVDAVKTGMLSNTAIVQAVAAAVQEHRLPNLVVDPVMVAKSGDPLLKPEAQQALKEELIPLATVITPNLHEAEALLGHAIENLSAMKEAARELHALGCRYVILKGGHRPIEGKSVDVVFDGQEYFFLEAPYVQTKHTHGTGCTFASAIAAGLARGLSPVQAFQRAKQYITEAIRQGLALGAGHGPTNHLVGVASRWVE